MLKVVIVTDGPYGERAYETIKEEFDCEFLELEAPTSHFADDIKLPEDKVKRMGRADILIVYVSHPDLTLELVEKLHHQTGWIIVGTWRGEGFKNQLERFKNVTCPENMCDLEKNRNPIFDQFVSKFGRPVVELKFRDDRVAEARVLRSSPCGSTFFVAEEMIGQEKEDLPIKAGLKIQHYPCRAPKMRLFADDECKKDMAAKFHKEAFEKALKKVK